MDEITDVLNSDAERREKEDEFLQLKEKYPQLKLRNDPWLRLASTDSRSRQDAFMDMHGHISDALKAGK